MHQAILLGGPLGLVELYPLRSAIKCRFVKPEPSVTTLALDGGTAVLILTTAILCDLADGGIADLSVHGSPAVVTVTRLGTTQAI